MPMAQPSWEPKNTYCLNRAYIPSSICNREELSRVGKLKDGQLNRQTCSLKISRVKMCEIFLLIVFDLMTIFMPRVCETRSPMAFNWFEWKWMAIKSNISPKEADKPVSCGTNDKLSGQHSQKQPLIETVQRGSNTAEQVGCTGSQY